MQVNNINPLDNDRLQQLNFLKSKSKYPDFNYVAEGHLKRTEPALIGGAADCSKCFYGLQLDTYVNGCSHECIYCWAKEELTKLDQWNSPRPIPIDTLGIWDLFYEAFETDKNAPMIKLIRKKVPLRLGSLSDPFLSLEKKYQNTLEILKILKYYDYPVVILTRSDAVARDDYMKLMDPHRVSVQFSIPSLNEKWVKILEPGAVKPLARLEALKKLMDHKIWSSVRLNPLFPNYPDGYYSKKQSGIKSEFNFFDLDMIDQIAEYNCRSLLVGFVHMDNKTMDSISKKIGINLADFLTETYRNSSMGFRYSMEEIRCYYQMIEKKCRDRGVEFSTCYLGLGESFFWKDQDLWADKKDCCNIKNHVSEFKLDTQELSMDEKLSILHPDMTALQRFIFPNWLYKMKSFFMKNLWS